MMSGEKYLSDKIRVEVKLLNEPISDNECENQTDRNEGRIAES
jgi:hypothetical protein